MLQNNMITMDPEYYDRDYPNQLCEKDEVVELGSIIIPIFFALVVVLSCIGNILVLVILALYESLKSLTNVFILNLALSDLLFTFGLPFWTSYFVWGWTFGEIGCKAVKFLFYVGFYSSVLFLTLMTIQRYMAVVHPLSDWEKCRGFSVAPFIVWILSGGLSLLGSFNSTVIPHLNSTYCEYGSVEIKSGIAYFQNAFFCIAFLIMGFCYGRMLRTITKKQAKKRHKDQNIHPFTDCTVSIRLDYAYYACRMLAFTHCCLNPAFLLFVDTRFCNNLRAIPRRVICKDLSL